MPLLATVVPSRPFSLVVTTDREGSEGVHGTQTKLVHIVQLAVASAQGQRACGVVGSQVIGVLAALVCVQAHSAATVETPNEGCGRQPCWRSASRKLRTARRSTSPCRGYLQAHVSQPLHSRTRQRNCPDEPYRSCQTGSLRFDGRRTSKPLRRCPGETAQLEASLPGHRPGLPVPLKPKREELLNIPVVVTSPTFWRSTVVLTRPYSVTLLWAMAVVPATARTTRTTRVIFCMKFAQLVAINKRGAQGGFRF